MANVDVTAAIKKFLKDTTCVSLELPNLSSQQRKQAKKLIEAHPEVKCESYGFGQDRQLHLFKQDRSWLPLDSRKEGRVNKQALQQSSAESKGPLTHFLGAETASSDCSTSASGRASDSEGTPMQSGREYQTLSQGLPVVNTFIHITEAPRDDRIVQSMPHGMFSQCLRSEQAAQNAKCSSKEQVEYALTSEATQQAVLSDGSHAIVQGLQKLPVFNGQVALVQGWDAEAGRYNILLASPNVPGSFQQAKVKPENLRPVVV